MYYLSFLGHSMSMSSPVASGLTATTAMKTLEHGGLQGTDSAVTTCRLPQQYGGVEHTFYLTLSSDTTSVLGVRISLVANKRNPPQPRDLT